MKLICQEVLVVGHQERVLHWKKSRLPCTIRIGIDGPEFVRPSRMLQANTEPSDIQACRVIVLCIPATVQEIFVALVISAEIGVGFIA